jgi:hypothetical protein
MPARNAVVTLTIGITLLGAAGLSAFSVVRLTSLGREMARISDELRVSRDDLPRANPMPTAAPAKLPEGNCTTEKLAELVAKVASLTETMAGRTDADEPTPDAPIELHTKEEAAKLLEQLGKSPSADELAEVITTLDSWVFQPDGEKVVQLRMSNLIKQLRRQVRIEVAQLQKAALESESGANASERHAEAGRILLLYPMSDDKAEAEEVRRMSSQQADVSARLEMMRRKRYNQWGVTRVKEAIDGYNENKSYLNPKKENPRLIESLTKALGDVDPLLLEPVVLDLYNYVIDLTKDSISPEDKVDLAQRMTDPAITRKQLGDF